MSKPKVDISSHHGEFGIAKKTWKMINEATSQGGQATWELARKYFKMKELARYLGEHYKAGDLDQYLIEGKDGDQPIVFAEYGDLMLTIRMSEEVEKKGEAHWIKTAHATISDAGLDVAQVKFYAEILGEIPGGAIILARIGRGIAAYFAACRTVETAEEVEEALAEAENASMVAVDGDAEEAAFSCSSAAGLAGGFLLVAAGLLVESFLANCMHHKLYLYNATDIDLKWEIAHVDAGVVYLVPKPHHGKGNNASGSIAKVREIFSTKVGSFGLFSSQTSSFAEGVGYLLHIKPSKQLPAGAWAKVQIPYNGANSIEVSADVKGTPAEIWNNWDDVRQSTHIKSEHGDYTFKMSMSYLSGEHWSSDLPRTKGYYYVSCLTLEKKGIWDKGA